MKTPRLPIITGIGAAALLLSGCISNPFGGGDAPRSAGTVQPADPVLAELAKMDANTDSVLTRVEFDAGLKARYAREDGNGNGQLEPSEVRALNDRLQSVQGMSPVIDWNADGTVDATEFNAQWRTVFDRSDVNGDDVLEGDELAGRARKRVPRDLPKPTFSGKDGRPPGSQ